MIFRRILGVSTALAAGLVGANCGLFSTTKWSSSEIVDTYKKYIQNPCRYTNITYPRVFASETRRTPLNNKVEEGIERLQRNTGISYKFLTTNPERYYFLHFKDYFLHFDYERKNPAVVYEFLTPANFIQMKNQNYENNCKPSADDRHQKKFANHKYKHFTRCLQEDFKCSIGHMASAGNHLQHPTAKRSTYKYVNSAPMNVVMNIGVWSQIEILARDLTTKYGKVHIFTGPIYDRTESDLDFHGDIEIPTHFFKVIIVEIGKEGDDIVDDFVNESAGKDKEGNGKIEDNGEETEQAEAQGACAIDDTVRREQGAAQQPEEQLGATGGTDVNTYHVISFIVENLEIGTGKREGKEKREIARQCLATLGEIESKTDLHNMFTGAKPFDSESPSGDSRTFSNKLTLPYLWEKERNDYMYKMKERYRPKSKASKKRRGDLKTRR